MNLLDIFPEKHFLLDLKARDKRGVFKEISHHLVEVGTLTEEVARKLERAVNKRESEATTGVGKGLAIPHAKNCKFLSEVTAVFARSKEGIAFNSVDGAAVHLFFMVASPAEFSDKHITIMKKISSMHKDDKTLKFLKTTESVRSIIEILKEIDEVFI